MSLKIVITCLVFAMASMNAFAQDSLKYSTLSLGVGINHVANKDLFQSPYTFKGTNLRFHSSYALVRATGQHMFDFSYSGGQIKSIVSPKANNKLIQFNYDYFFKLNTKSANRKFVPSVGAGLHTLLSSTNYLPYIESPTTYLSGGAYITLGGQVLYHLNKKSDLRMQIGLPLVGLLYRPDFEINGKTLTKPALPWKSNLFSVKLEYDYKFTRKVSATLMYNYSYFTFDEPRPITILQNGFSIGLRKTF
jgi:hypothetical protein